LDEHVPLHQNLVVVMKPYAAAHPEVVYSYLEGYLEGLRDFFNDPDVAVAAIGKYTKTDPQLAKQAYEAIRPALDAYPLVQESGFKTIQELGPNTKTRSLNLSEAHDDTFLTRLKASGFLDKLGIKK
ncbi:MAG: hypothetical protein KGJ86_18890, partial [Chloroflexota bacterium]|nr:hypothetical protein [Chloroflexota bacterium]